MSWTLLIISVVCSTLLFVIFRLYERFKVKTLEAIVVNYFVASTLSIFNYGKIPSLEHLAHSKWLWIAMSLGLIFILLFRLMAFCSQKIGISSTTIANKTTFVFPVIFGILLWGEEKSWWKFLGVLLALASIFLTAEGKKSEGSIKNLLWLLILFFGGGLLETFLGHAQNELIPKGEEALFTATIFGTAGIIGLIITLFSKPSFNIKSIIGGIALGVPNFASIFLFVLCLSNANNPTGIDKSVAFPVANMGIIILGTFLGLLLFKERISAKKALAVLMAVGAICSFSIA